MRKIIWCLPLFAASFGACSDSGNKPSPVDGPDPADKAYRTTSYVPIYFEGKMICIDAGAKFWTITCDSERGGFFYNPELYPYHSMPDNDARFLEIATRNGDRSYDGYHIPESAPCAWAENFAEVHVTSDTDWDAAHPAGALLDDLALFRCETFAPFIDRGYTDPDNRTSVVSKRLDALTSADLRVLSVVDMTISFTTPPDDPSAEHTLTLRFVTADGEVLELSNRGIPPVLRE